MAGLTLSNLQDLRDALTRARLSGTREVRDASGESITYKSDAEMARALAAVEAQIQSLISAAPNVVKFRASKGT